MRKILVLLLFIIIFSNSALAMGKVESTLSRIENSLFGIEYSNQSNNKRLERIEEAVYGEAKSGNIKTRLEKLSADAATNQMGQEISPKRDTFEDPQDSYVDNSKLAQSKSKTKQSNQNYYYDDSEEEKAEPNIDYPVLNELEEKVFGKTYKNLDLNTRLSKLEQHSLKKTYDDAFSDRVERLKSKLSYKHSKPFQYQYYDNYLAQNLDNYAGSEYNYDYYTPKTTNNKSSKEFFNGKDYLDEELSEIDFRTKLNKLEKKVYKNSFSSDTIDNRLSRLESTIFNTQFSKDSEKTRLNRISSAVQAQKSARKYDSNSIQQKLGTALQIGMMVLMVVAMIL